MREVIVYEGALDPASIGGARFHFTGLAAALARRTDIELILLTPKYRGAPAWPTVEGAKHLPVSVGRKSAGALALYELRKMALLVRIRRRYGKGIVLLTRLGLLNWSAVAARLIGFRVILEVNGLPANELKDRGFGPLVRSVVALHEMAQRRAANGIVAVTEGIARRLRETTSCPITVIPNGSDVPTPSAVPSDAPTEAAAFLAGGGIDRPLLVYVGALAPWQDLELTLRVLHRLRTETDRDWRLAVVGDGEGRETFLAIRDALRLGDAVHWLGWQPKAVVDHVLASANIGLVPLRSKGGSDICGSPLKLFEYLAAGLPVVASEVDGVRELRYRRLVKFREGDADSFARACIKALAMRPVTGGELMKLQKSVSWDQRVEQLLGQHIATDTPSVSIVGGGLRRPWQSDPAAG